LYVHVQRSKLESGVDQRGGKKGAKLERDDEEEESTHTHAAKKASVGSKVQVPSHWLAPLFGVLGDNKNENSDSHTNKTSFRRARL